MLRGLKYLASTIIIGSDNMQSVGIVGLGKMGSGIAENLLKSGFLNAIYKRTRDGTIKSFEKKGVYVAKSPKDLASKVDTVLLSVPNDSVNDVIFGNDGLVNGLKEKSTIIDTGNCDPRQSNEIYTKLKKRGMAFLDVGVSGGPERARKGNLAVWVGGDKGTYEKSLAILKAIGQPRYLGPSGTGHTVKMLHNVMEQAEMQGIAEVANMARDLKLDPKNIFNTIKEGLVQSHLSDIYLKTPDEEIKNREPVVEGGDYPKMALEIAKDTVPLVEIAASYWVRAISRAPPGERDEIINEAIKAISEELKKLKDGEKFKYGYQTLGAIRKSFGGHK